MQTHQIAEVSGNKTASANSRPAMELSNKSVSSQGNSPRATVYLGTDGPATCLVTWN